MLYLHYCNPCKRIHILSGHRSCCPACSNRLTELSITYESYIKLNRSERDSLLIQCSDASSLCKISTFYVARRPRKE